MEYVLLVFLFTSSGEYVGKFNKIYPNQAACSRAAQSQQPVTKFVTIQTLCVTKDHWAGRRVDPGIPLDFDYSR